MIQKTYETIEAIAEHQGAGFVLLLDPDNLPLKSIEDRVQSAVDAGVDIFFVGGSLLLGQDFSVVVELIKAAAGDHPVILFPGSLFQLSSHADALLYLSVVSGRNAEHLIGSQVMAAPSVWRMKLEAISCGYMLIESGKMTSANFVSNSFPIPRDKPKIALAHALAAQYLGMKSIYLEAGSGAQLTVPDEMISMVCEHVQIPVIVGGGIRSPKEAGQKARAGAKYIVVGNFFEKADSARRLTEFAEAIHYRR